MTDRSNRDPLVQVNDISIVNADAEEDTDYWLVSADGDEFPIRLRELHDLMHVIHQLHDEAHHH